MSKFIAIGFAACGSVMITWLASHAQSEGRLGPDKVETLVVPASAVTNTPVLQEFPVHRECVVSSDPRDVIVEWSSTEAIEGRADSGAGSWIGLHQSSSDLALQLREGNACIGEVVDLASALVGNTDSDTRHVHEDGTVSYQLSMPESVGSAELTITEGGELGEQQYELVVNWRDSMHDRIQTDLTKGSRLEIRLGLDESLTPSHFSAFTTADLTGGHTLCNAFLDAGWIPVGGALRADSDSSDFTRVSVRCSLREEDGELLTKQRVFPPEASSQNLAEVCMHQLTGQLIQLRKMQ